MERSGTACLGIVEPIPGLDTVCGLTLLFDPTPPKLQPAIRGLDVV
jgi:hypothetical protein